MAGVNTTTQTQNRLGGVASISIDGTIYMLVSDAVWSPTRWTHESKLGMDGYHGYTEKYVAGKIGCKLRDNGAIRVGDFNNMTNSTIVMQLANGKTVYGSNMVNVNAQEVEAMEGTFDVMFEGPSVWEG